MPVIVEAPPRNSPLIDKSTAPVVDDDTELVLKAQKGDSGALNALLERHRPRILNHAHRLMHNDPDEAEDLAQLVIFRVWRKIGLFDCRSKFTTWLYRITVNLAKNRWKQMERQRLSQTVSLDTALDEPEEDNRPLQHPDPNPDPRQLVMQAELEAAVSAGISLINPKHRMVLTMFAICGFSYEVIAEMLEENVSTIKSRICRGRQELMTVVGEQLEALR